VSRPSVFPLFVPSIIATAANLEFAVFMCFRVDLMDDFKVEIDVQCLFESCVEMLLK
jgi:hypothetical protein